MRRFLIVTSVLALSAGTALAQGEPGSGKNSLGIGFELSVPVSEFADVAGTGYGGFVRYQYGYDSRSAVTILAGYVVWSEKELGVATKIQPKAFRFLVGGKYYFVPNFYGSLEFGLDAYNFTRTGAVVGFEATDWRFMLPVGIGYQISGFEIAAKYFIFDTNFASFSFTVGYNWAL